MYRKGIQIKDLVLIRLIVELRAGLVQRRADMLRVM
jgi:hypothetical protein